MQIRTETFFESNLLNWLEQWCCRSTCCTWGVLKASGEHVASRLVVPTHHCKRQKFGGTGLSWWASPGQTMLRTLQSPYRMQNSFTERTEGFCMQRLPGLRSFTGTSICSKRKDLYLSDILEGVCMNGGEARRILHVHPVHYWNQRILAPCSLGPQVARYDEGIWHQNLDLHMLLCLPMECKLEVAVQFNNTQ